MPGEHHFVSVYLVPKLYELNRIIPDYVNPDGTKGIIGDVVYFRDGAHQLGIEVKLATIRLTKNEFNSWIVAEDKSRWPHVFVGVGTQGVVMLPWREFRRVYIEAVHEKDADWVPMPIEDGYGPMKAVNKLFSSDDPSGYFRKVSELKQAKILDAKFLEALHEAITC